MCKQRIKDQGQNPETPTFRDEKGKIPVKMKGRYIKEFTYQEFTSMIKFM